MHYNAYAKESHNLYLNNYPTLNVFIEGPDGAGKTSILNFLSKTYPNLVIPKSSQMGLMPNKYEEVVSWFQEQDPFVTARLYLMSHEKRFQYIDNYSSRGHYELTKKTRGTPPILILSDRGPLSAKAYAYSSIKLNSNLPYSVITQFIEQQFHFSPKTEQSISILLYPDMSKAHDLFLRLQNVPDNDREIKLIEGQIEYYQNSNSKNIQQNVLKLDPFASLDDNLSEVKNFVDQAVMLMLAKEKTNLNFNNIKRVYLAKIIQKILNTKRLGEIVIIGGLVQKGYTDNDIDIIFKNINDKENIYNSLKVLHHNLHIFQANEELYNKDNYKLIIQPED